jgi:hypothetical protein
MVDLLGEVVDYLRLNIGAANLQTLLGPNCASQITADFDPGNVARPYIIATQAHWENKYKPLGNAVRVERQIISFLCFTDTRAESIALLNELEAALITYSTDCLGPPTIEDKVTQLDLSKIDAYKGTLNCCWFVGQNQTGET